MFLQRIRISCQSGYLQLQVAILSQQHKPLWAGVLPVAPTGSTSQDSAATAD